ncbi:hypothetical protein E4U42_000915 [Claviceps africana]|uniref:Telomere capping, CST complex subunit-domain-containing protein n=1 Tax=Claviceps africana TaxID=83212 RepID=A0A8K0J9K5_9HYPO|nr:hypothetical protein E4U42_000915 [Claviceps africana]
MSRGPPPSKLCFLSQVPAQKTGVKVRFLGCVTSYDTQTATVHLGHVYPRGTNVLVAVDLHLVLETMKPGMTDVGEWVNVVGYVEDGRVQALMIWSTGPLDVGEYERAVEEAMALG